jgi:hypothetical protein
MPISKETLRQVSGSNVVPPMIRNSRVKVSPVDKDIAAFKRIIWQYPEK